MLGPLQGTGTRAAVSRRGGLLNEARWWIPRKVAFLAAQGCVPMCSRLVGVASWLSSAGVRSVRWLVSGACER